MLSTHFGPRLLLVVVCIAAFAALTELDQWMAAAGIRKPKAEARSPTSNAAVRQVSPPLPTGAHSPRTGVPVTSQASPPPSTTGASTSTAGDGLQVHPLGAVRMFGRRTAARPSVTVAVEMAGHMREYQRCAATLRNRVLIPLRAALTVATYPHIGRKRFGVRSNDISSLRRDAVTVEDLTRAYGDAQMLAVLLADEGRVERAVARAMPSVNHHFRWALYQVFMMEVAHNLTRAAAGDDAFDFTIRVRPDAFVVAELSIARVGGGGASGAAAFRVTFHCNESMLGRSASPPPPTNDSDAAAVPANEWLHATVAPGTLLQPPHHPRLRWFNDPLADHSLIGRTRDFRRFAGSMFSGLARMPRATLNATYFVPGDTLERMWARFAAREASVNLTACPGWHFVLRDPDAYRNTTVTDGEPSRHRRALVAAIFAIMDPRTVGCPVPPNETSTSVGWHNGHGKRKRR